MWFFLAALIVVVVAGAAGAGYLAVRAGRSVKTGYERSNQVVPGIPTSAPTSWLGSHDPEARLHRRLIDAVKALHAHQQLDTLGTYLDLRVELEQQAVAIDAELVSVSALPLAQREGPLGQLTAAVESIEQAIGEVAAASVQESTDQLARTLEGLRRRSSTLDAARAALDEIEDRTEPVDRTGPSDPTGEPGTASGSA